MRLIDKEQMINKVLYIFLAFLILSCSENSEATIASSESEVHEYDGTMSIENLKWIEGVWLDSTTFSFRTPKVSFMEQWKFYPDSISGKGLSIKENDTTIMELLCIREVNGVINYIARPSGEAIIGFPLTFMSETEAVFENPVHDFPQKIRYLKTSTDSLQVIISGIIPQGERVVTFKMRSAVSF